MAEVFGYELVARALQNEGVDTMFFIMGGPMLGAQDTCRKLGLRSLSSPTLLPLGVRGRTASPERMASQK